MGESLPFMAMHLINFVVSYSESCHNMCVVIVNLDPK